MKKLMVVFALLLVVAGVGGGLWYTNKLPFLPRHGKQAKAGAKGAANAAKAPAKKTPVASSAPPMAPRPPAPAVSDEQIAARKAAAEKSLTRMASVYESMPADESARIMQKLPDPLVIRMLGRMDERQVGKILLSFAPDRAAKITLALTR